MSSATCFNLDQSKILSSGNGLNGSCTFAGVHPPNTQHNIISKPLAISNTNIVQTVVSDE